MGLILGVITVNVIIGLAQEGKAEKAAEAIKAMLSSTGARAGPSPIRLSRLWSGALPPGRSGARSGRALLACGRKPLRARAGAPRAAPRRVAPAPRAQPTSSAVASASASTRRCWCRGTSFS
jgi:hypothetical protein